MSIVQGWGTYMLSRAAWIVDYHWRAEKFNQFYLEILPLSSKGR